MKTIVAVAIGPTYQQVSINDPNNIPTGVRRYINGFVSGFPHALGTDYTIDYREAPKADLNGQVFSGANYLLCLSTSVLRAAAPVVGQPIVGICSHPERETFSNQANVYGVSPERSDDAKDAYERLLKTVNPALPQDQVVVLHDSNYTPSEDGLDKIKQAYPHAQDRNVHSPNDVKNVIANASPKTGVLLLAVDWMFGSARDIIGWASNKGALDFWLVTDWVVPTSNASAFGGYGVPQERSGRYLAPQLDAIWNGGQPNPRWKHVQPNDRVWKASQTRANQASVSLNTNNGPVIVP